MNYINVQLIVEINHQAVLSDEHYDIHEHRLTLAHALAGWGNDSCVDEPSSQAGWPTSQEWPWFFHMLHPLGFKNMKYLSSPKNYVITSSISFKTKFYYEKALLCLTSLSTQLYFCTSHTHIFGVQGYDLTTDTAQHSVICQVEWLNTARSAWTLKRGHQQPGHPTLLAILDKLN